MEFDQGETPTISVFNKASVPLGLDLDALIAAMQEYVDKHIEPHWGTPAILKRSLDYVPGTWAMVFLDNADQAGALAYHDLTPDGLPVSKVFVKTIQKYQESLSVSASHELVEMLVDPGIQMMAVRPDGKSFMAYETADPVEQLSFPVAGMSMSDFVYPSYFESFRKTGPFDHMHQVTKPFQVLHGGYAIIYTRMGGWKQIFGSREKEAAFKLEDRKAHRSEIRRSR
jgi:hypothetical protein